MLGRIGSLIARVAEEAGSVVGLRFGTEEPRYTSEKVIGLEIRNYRPRIAAETTVFGMRTRPSATGSGASPATSSAATTATPRSR